MRVEYVNPFVESSFEMLEEALGENTAEREKLRAVEPPIRCRGVASMIGVVGQLRGRFIIDMTTETAMAIAGRMNGETFEIFNDLAHATINELCNWISGRATMKLVDAGFNVDITAPSIFQGEGVELWDDQGKVLEIRVKTPCGEVFLNIAIEEDTRAK